MAAFTASENITSDAHLLENKRLQKEIADLSIKNREQEAIIIRKVAELEEEKWKSTSIQNEALELKENMQQLNEKVDNLTRRNLILQTQLKSKEKLVTDLNNGNLLSKKLLEGKDAVIKKLMAWEEKAKAGNIARRTLMESKCVECLKLQLDLKKATECNLHANAEVEKIKSELSAQVLLIGQLNSALADTTTKLEQVNNALSAKGLALRDQENTLNRVKDESNQQKLQLEQNEKAMEKLKLEEQEMQSELFECKRELENQRQINSELEARAAASKNVCDPVQVFQIDTIMADNRGHAATNQIHGVTREQELRQQLRSKLFKARKILKKKWTDIRSNGGNGNEKPTKNVHKRLCVPAVPK